MIETKILHIFPDEFDREEAIVNEHACFGWQIHQRSTTVDVTTETSNTSVTTSTSTSKITLTFQRDSEIRNRVTLDNLYNQYTLEKENIAAAGRKAKISKIVPTVLCAIFTVLSALILFPTFYVGSTEWLMSDDVGMKIFLAVMTIFFSGCLGVLLGVVPVMIASSLKEDKARKAIRPSIYAKMSAIASEASKYL